MIFMRRSEEREKNFGCLRGFEKLVRRFVLAPVCSQIITRKLTFLALCLRDCPNYCMNFHFGLVETCPKGNKILQIVNGECGNSKLHRIKNAFPWSMILLVSPMCLTLEIRPIYISSHAPTPISGFRYL